MGFESLAALDMFQGSMPLTTIRQVARMARDWDVADIYVGCSGTFKVERTLHDRFAMHSNDVTLYSCAIGWHLAGVPWRLAVRPEAEAEWGWLGDYMGTSADDLATVLASTTMLQEAMSPRRDNRYFTSKRGGYRRQFAAMHAKTLAKLPDVHLASFYAGDVRDHMAAAPKDTGFVSFPPFFGGGYERMFAGLHHVFDWDPPEYRMFDDADVAGMFAQAREFRHWAIGSHMVLDDYHDDLRAVVRSHGLPVYLYGDSGARSVVANRPPPQKPLLARRLEAGMTIGTSLRVHPVSAVQFQSLRASVMNAHIAPASPHFACMVSVDGLLVGGFAFQWEQVGTTLNMFSDQLPGPTAYLLVDFPVPGTDYTRLAKLVLAAALSTETRNLLERAASRRFRSLKTTAFSKHPVSMKYRGMLQLLDRKPPRSPDAAHNHELIYGSLLGRWTLDEGMQAWRDQHSQRQTTPA
jgi:hypothetical protein